LRVAVFAPDPLRHDGIVALLADADGLSVQPFQVDREQDVIVIVTNEITRDTIKAVLLARRIFDSPSVVVADERIDIDLEAAVEAGVVSAMHIAEATTRRLADAIEQAAGTGPGPTAESADLAGQVRQIRRLSVEQQGKPHFSEREIVLLRHLADGCDTNEVAKNMHLSERTVKYLLWGVMRRFHLRNRAHAVAFAIQADVI
jgi:DNA-binding NarL/FixJ family response regulator